MRRATFFSFLIIAGISLSQSVVSPKRKLKYTDDFVFPTEEEHDDHKLPVWTYYKSFQAVEHTTEATVTEKPQIYVDQVADCAFYEAHGPFDHARLLLVRRNSIPIFDPVHYVRDVLTYDLELYHLTYNVLQAKMLDHNILFEMETESEAHEVLQTYCKLAGIERREPLTYQIVPTDRNFFDNNDLDVRIKKTCK